MPRTIIHDRRITEFLEPTQDNFAFLSNARRCCVESPDKCKCELKVNGGKLALFYTNGNYITKFEDDLPNVVWVKD
jgi:hypothetical protein